MDSTVKLKQGSQLRTGTARVGLIRVGAPGGVPTARLAVRTPENTDVVDLQLGDSVPCGEHDSVTLVDVEAPTGDEKHGTAILRVATD